MNGKQELFDKIATEAAMVLLRQQAEKVLGWESGYRADGTPTHAAGQDGIMEQIAVLACLLASHVVAQAYPKSGGEKQ